MVQELYYPIHWVVSQSIISWEILLTKQYKGRTCLRFGDESDVFDAWNMVVGANYGSMEVFINHSLDSQPKE